MRKEIPSNSAIISFKISDGFFTSGGIIKGIRVSGPSGVSIRGMFSDSVIAFSREGFAGTYSYEMQYDYYEGSEKESGQVSGQFSISKNALEKADVEVSVKSRRSTVFE